MDHPATLLTAQIQFLDTELALIHIPLSLYALFVQPILQLILPSRQRLEDVQETGNDLRVTRRRRPWEYDYPFVNVSITPLECSIACSRAIANNLFLPILDALDEASRDRVVVSRDDYVVLQVDGDGEALEAGQRVIDLTAPLAIRGIPIFFVTTYFSDYVLVPSRSVSQVIEALKEHNFVFESNTEAFVNVSSPLLAAHSRSTSAAAMLNENPFDSKPSTPPPSSVEELQLRTFGLMSRHGIKPSVDPSIRLVQCAGRKDTTMRPGIDPGHATALMTKRLQLGFVRCITRRPRPAFFSVTLTDTEPASLLMERGLLEEFEDSAGDADADVILLGLKADPLTPIMFDLGQLPMESTGIVCGVAAKLVGGLRQAAASGDAPAPVEMSYLSTAKAGTVIVSQADAERALESLQSQASAHRPPPEALGLGLDPPLSKPIAIRPRPRD